MKKRKFKTNILVRNNRIKLMEESGLTVNYSVLSDREYLNELKLKLIEEANEVNDAETIEELKGELVDVLEVIDCILAATNLTLTELENLKLKKQIKIGKFDNKFKTNHIEMDENNKELSYYLSKPHKYPEIL